MYYEVFFDNDVNIIGIWAFEANYYSSSRCLAISESVGISILSPSSSGLSVALVPFHSFGYFPCSKLFGPGVN
jgi:hypothetical protein